MSRSHFIATIACLAAAFALAGCDTGQPLFGPRSRPEQPTTLVAPAYATLVEAQNGRVDRLEVIYGRGIVEFRWLDSEGKEHFEPQVNVDLWVQLPWKTAMQCEKMFETYLWLGSDEEQFWVFDLTTDDKVLFIGEHGSELTLDSLPPGIEPLALIDLFGLSRLPAPGASDPEVVADETIGSWAVVVDGRGGPMRIHFDRSNLRPIRVETLDRDGRPLATSTMRDWLTVPIEGIALGLHPQMASKITITDRDEKTSILLAFNEFAIETNPRVFELDRLMRSLEPQRTERLD